MQAAIARFLNANAGSMGDQRPADLDDVRFAAD